MQEVYPSATNRRQRPRTAPVPWSRSPSGFRTTMKQSLLRRTVETWQAEGIRGVAVQGRDRIRHEIAQAARRFRFYILRSLGRGQKENELIRDSIEYWNSGERFGVDVKDYSHWRGAGPWKDDKRWLTLGRLTAGCMTGCAA